VLGQEQTGRGKKGKGERNSGEENHRRVAKSKRYGDRHTYNNQVLKETVTSKEGKRAGGCTGGKERARTVTAPVKEAMQKAKGTEAVSRFGSAFAWKEAP